MTTISVFIAYTIGVLLSYVSFRWMTKIEEGTWTRKDRRFFLICSLLSWITFAFAVIYFIFDFLPSRDEESDNNTHL